MADLWWTADKCSGCSIRSQSFSFESGSCTTWFFVQVWIDPTTGYADEFLSLIRSLDATPEVVITLLLLIFGISHSGLAALRPQGHCALYFMRDNDCPGERLMGARAYRVLFALTSLPLAALTVGYFINHRYQGTQLWMIQGIPLVRPMVWLISFVSFWFLYPSTFNLLEVHSHECMDT